MNFRKSSALLVVGCSMVLGAVSVKAQANNDDLKKKTDTWIAGLNITDQAKAQKVETAIVTHLAAVRDWHNSHPVTQNPGGINPATGNALSNMDWQVIYCSQQPKSVHENLMSVLNAELTPAQVEQVLDDYTIGKVAFTLKGYESIVPNLTETERAEILKNLKQAREQAIDYKSIKEISAIFEIYKTKCEQYLNSNGRNWHQMFKAYVDKVKAEKAAKQKKQ